MRWFNNTTFPRRHASRRLGFTMVEMLVTVVVTLLVMLALTQCFQWIGANTRDGRAGIEMSGPLRGAAWRLQGDLCMRVASPAPSGW